MRYWMFAWLAIAVPATAAATWREASSDHFVIYSEQNAKTLEAFASHLERYDKGMRVVYGLPDENLGPRNRVTIYVVSSISAIRRLAGAKSGSPLAGFYIARASGSVAFVPKSTGSAADFDFDSRLILQHEYAHHFLMQNFVGAYPAWFVEGFAELCSTAKPEANGAIGFGLPAQHRAYELVEGQSLPIETLLAPTTKQLKSADALLLYGRGWLLTHYLTFERARRGQLSSYLKRINQGEGSLEAAKAAFGDLKTLDRELDRYVHRSRLEYLRLPAAMVPAGKVAIRELSPGEEATMEVRMQSDRGVDSELAKTVVLAARKAAAPFSNDTAAQVVLAEAEFDAGNHDEAEAAADRALRIDPKNIDALIYKGRAKAGLARTGSSDADGWKEIRRWFVAANRADPDYPEPLILFYDSFGMEGVRPTPNAVKGLLRALELAPADRGLRWTAARQLLTDNKGQEARRVLAPIAYHPHRGEMAEDATAIITALEAGGPEHALRKWDELDASANDQASSPESASNRAN